MTAVEALLRWRHPRRGLVPPDDFIPLAEETGLIIAIGEWVLRTACNAGTAVARLRIAVNLSPVQFRHRELVETVKSVLDETGLEPGRLELEITESMLINDTDAALDILTALKAIGVNIAMDDFGTGYSSLGYLNSFPFDKIKIDRSFISSMDETGKSHGDRQVGDQLGREPQHDDDRRRRRDARAGRIPADEGCEQVQGYFFGRPVPAIELSAFLKNWKGFEADQTASPPQPEQRTTKCGCRTDNSSLQRLPPCRTSTSPRDIRTARLQTSAEPCDRTRAALPERSQIERRSRTSSRPSRCSAFDPQSCGQLPRKFAAFRARSLYAVKCNPHPFVLATLFDAGITDFDVASIEEVRLIDELFGSAAGQFFNNPAKTRPAIRVGEPRVRHSLLHRRLRRRNREDP